MLNIVVHDLVKLESSSEEEMCDHIECGYSFIKTTERERDNTVELKCLDDEKKEDRLMNDVYLHHWDQD